MTVPDPANEYYPAPFPEHLPTIQLETIHISDLYAGDDETTSNLFTILCNEGFFYLDLTADARGEKFLELSKQLHRAAKDIFNNVSIADKEEWKGDPLKGVLDTGYKAMGKDERGQPTVSEVLNVPAYELVHEANFALPPWLRKYRETYKAFAEQGQVIGHLLLNNIERGLHLEPGALSKMHELTGASGGFVRMFRLPAPVNGEQLTGAPPTPGHTDANSITILFNWQGGLQIARPTGDAAGRAVQMIEDMGRSQDEWLYVQPKPGHVVINLGDPMVVLTNGLLASGRHRVVTPPGKQAGYDRYSVLTGLRAQSETPMRALRSDVIPPETEEQKSQETITVMDYAVNKVRKLIQQTVEMNA